MVLQRSFVQSVVPVAAPAIAALVIGRTVPFAIVAVIGAALLLALSGWSFTVRGGSLGAAIVIAAVHGPIAANVAIAVAAIGAAGLATIAGERVLALFPRRAVDALLGGFAIAGVVRIAMGATPAHTSASALVGDTLALAILFSLEAARIVRPSRESAISHMTAASAALPVGYARRVPGSAAPLALLAAVVVIVALLAPQVRSALVLAGVALAALGEIVPRRRRFGLRGALFLAAIGALAVLTRPAVAVVFALVIAMPLLGTWPSFVKAPERG